MDPLRTYDYLLNSRARVLAAIRPLSPQQYLRPFPFGLKSIASTITHIMISEWYYIERLEGRLVAPYEQWPIKYETPPAFDVVESTWGDQAQRTRAAIAAQRDWSRRISYDSFPDDQGKRFHISATAGDMVTQLVLHEVHHRSQIMSMLRGLGEGVPPLEDLDFNALMFERRELA
ncbi:MAG: DinB family protein [Planctomycetota bacterium]